MIFNQFRIPPAYQHRIFSYGIWSAIIFRLILILLGSWLVTRFHWLIYIMGIFLLLTGIKMFFASKEKNDLYSSWLYQAIKRWFRITDKFDGQKFFVRKPSHAGVPVLYATPLFIALIFIEFSDLVFAFDSIPAIFAITRDPFIVWTSNIFAILGLRALYFLLSGMVTRFHLLKYGIALILVFVGLKMISEPWVHVSVEFSLGVIFIILLSFTVLSIKIKQRKP
jgi:tellurite resistance protein TerC